MQKRVLEAIRAGQVKMRPKWHFILKAILAALGGALLLIAVLYLTSFILFISRQTGVLFMPIFGVKGWHVFFASLPWLLIVLLLVFILVLEILVKRYSFAYRRPLLYSAVGIVLFTIAGGYIIAATSLHGRLFKSAERGELPFAGRFYREYGLRQVQNVHLGTISEITDNGFLIKGRRNDALRIIISAQTRFPLGTDFVKDDTVVVFGERDGETVRALGVRKIDDEFDPEPDMRKPRK